MLTDHIGAVCFPGVMALRLIGRLAFPIYCFLLAQGLRHTRSHSKYVLRLVILAVLSELPFDLALYGSFSWAHQNVMLTLILGASAVLLLGRVSHPLVKSLLILPFFVVAELLHTDYGGYGVLLVVLFSVTEHRLWQTVGLALIYLLMHGFAPPLFAVAAMIPISMYSGKKISRKFSAQLAMNLFYPVHLTLLWILGRLI